MCMSGRWGDVWEANVFITTAGFKNEIYVYLSVCLSNLCAVWFIYKVIVKYITYSMYLYSAFWNNVLYITLNIMPV